MAHINVLELETKIGNSETTQQAIWPIAKSLLKRVLQALNFIRPRNPTQLLTAWKICSNPMACGMETMNSGCRLEVKLCSRS
jgi:hypothetical protein